MPGANRSAQVLESVVPGGRTERSTVMVLIDWVLLSTHRSAVAKPLMTESRTVACMRSCSAAVAAGDDHRNLRGLPGAHHRGARDGGAALERRGVAAVVDEDGPAARAWGS